jgi:Flagellar hook-length control protein FliK
MLDLSSLIAGPNLSEFPSNSGYALSATRAEDEPFELEVDQDRDELRDRDAEESSFVSLLASWLQQLPTDPKSLPTEDNLLAGGASQDGGELQVTGIGSLFTPAKTRPEGLALSFATDAANPRGESNPLRRVPSTAVKKTVHMGDTGVTEPLNPVTPNPAPILVPQPDSGVIHPDLTKVAEVQQVAIASPHQVAEDVTAVTQPVVPQTEGLPDSAGAAPEHSLLSVPELSPPGPKSEVQLFEPLRTLPRDETQPRPQASNGVVELRSGLPFSEGAQAPTGPLDETVAAQSSPQTEAVSLEPGGAKPLDSANRSEKLNRYRSASSDAKGNEQRESRDSSVGGIPSVAPAELTHTTKHAEMDAIVPRTLAHSPLAAVPYRVDDIDRNDSIDRIVDSPIEAESTPTELNLQLDSPDLGTVWVSVKETQGSVFASIETSSAAAYDQLMQQLHALRETIQDAGVALGSLELGWRSGSESEGRRQPMESLARHFEHALPGREMAPVKSKWHVDSASHNYQVNVFA